MKSKILFIILFISFSCFTQDIFEYSNNDAAKVSDIFSVEKLGFDNKINLNNYKYNTFLDSKLKTRYQNLHYKYDNNLTILKGNDKSEEFIFDIESILEENYIFPNFKKEIVEDINEYTKIETHPLDNSISCSNKDFIISISNNFIKYYSNYNKKSIYRVKLANFIDDEDFINPCDPKIIYDFEYHRFILYLQKCDSYNNGKILIGFSKTDNPLDGWNFFKIKSVPTEFNIKDSFFDYPKITISKNSLFISGNIYSNDGETYEQSIVYQFDKKTGFNNDNLKYRYWYKIEEKPFTLKPVNWIYKYKKGALLLSTSKEKQIRKIEDKPFLDHIKLYYITDNIYNNPKMKFYKIPKKFKRFAQVEQQKGENFLAGDIRMQDALFYNNNLFYVFTSGDKDNRSSKIDFNKFNFTNATNTFKMLGDNKNTSYFYPSIQFLSKKNESENIIVQFSSCSKTSPININIKSCNKKLNCSKDDVVKVSQNKLNSSIGDYSSITKNYKTNDLYCATTFVNKSKKIQTNIIKITEITSDNKPNNITRNYKFKRIKFNNKFKNLKINIILKYDNKEEIIYNGYFGHGNKTVVYIDVTNFIKRKYKLTIEPENNFVNIKSLTKSFTI